MAHLGSSIRRAVAILVVVGAALTIVSSATAHTTSGSATPGNDGSHPWSSDLCSWSPNSLPGVFNFAHACKHHDGCYAGFPSSGKPTYWVSRYTCDQWFLNDMRASCAWQHGFAPARWNCENYARTYYSTVRALAWYAYKGPWRN